MTAIGTLVYFLLLSLFNFTLAQPCTPSNTSAPSWAIDIQYAAQTLVNYNGKLFECLQAHTSEFDWAPPEVPALWAVPTPCGVNPWAGQTLYQVDSEVTFNGITYICTQAHESEVGWTPDQTRALWQPVGMSSPTNATTVTTPICRIEQSPGFVSELVEILGYSNVSGANVSVIINQNIYDGSAANGKTLYDFGGISFLLQIYVNNNELITVGFATAVDFSSTIHIHWGPLVLGATSANLTVSTNNTVSGSIDGEIIRPFQAGAHPSNLTLLNGQAGPMLSPYGGLNGTLNSLQTLIASAIDACLSPSNGVNTTSTINTKALLRRQDWIQDPGHFSDPYSEFNCNFCKGGVYFAGGVCGFLCGVACVASFGLACGGCVAGCVTGVTLGIEGCEASGLCCPVHCGSSGFLAPPNCCDSDETCLNSVLSLCCSGDQLPCAGRHCCNQDQSCISQGIQQGTCCPTTPVNYVCGDFCCPEGANSCTGGGTCCAPQDACGSICCNPVDPVQSVPSLLGPMYCADAERQLCCPQGTTARDGVCCAPGQIIVDGICCAPGNVACNGECCLGTCTPDGVCQFSITDAQCQALGSFASCGSQYPSWECQSCTAQGCCAYTPK